MAARKSIGHNGIPFLPGAVVDAYHQNELAFFIGAGISRLHGLKGWDELAHDLITSLFTPKESDQILNKITGNKELISIAYEHASSSKKKDKFFEIFAKALEQTEKNVDIYSTLAKLKKVLFISTNCDGLLERILGRESCSTICTTANLNTRQSHYLFYLHGRFVDKDVDDQNSLVFTSREYVKRYSDESFREFLRYLFATKTIVFLGYGLTEFELLDYIVGKINLDGRHPHYILEGFYSHLGAMRKAKATYYKSLGITLIPYSKDKEGYNQQIHIINRWVEILSQPFYSDFNDVIQIQELIKNRNEQNVNTVCEKIEKDRNHVLSKEVMLQVRKQSNYIKWIDALFKRGFFSIKYCPKPEKLDEGIRYPSFDLLDGLHDLLVDHPRSKALEKIACSVSKSIIDDLVALPDDSLMKDNMRVLIPLWEICLTLENAYLPSNMVQYLQILSPRWKQRAIHSMMLSDFYRKWDAAVFASVFEVLFCNPTSKEDVALFSYEGLRFFKENKPLPETFARAILPILEAFAQQKFYPLSLYEFVIYLDDISYKDTNLSIIFAFQGCIKAMQQEEQPRYVYKWINMMNASIAISKIGIYILGKQPDIPIALDQIQINPWEKQVLESEWIKCLYLRSSNLSSQDYHALLTQIEHTSYSSDTPPQYKTYRMWQIANLAADYFREFKEIDKSLDSQLKDIHRPIKDTLKDTLITVRDYETDVSMLIPEKSLKNMASAQLDEWLKENLPDRHINDYPAIAEQIVTWLVLEGNQDIAFIQGLFNRSLLVTSYVFQRLLVHNDIEGWDTFILTASTALITYALENEKEDHSSAGLQNGLRVLEYLVDKDGDYTKKVHAFCQELISRKSNYTLLHTSNKAQFTSTGVLNCNEGIEKRRSIQL